MANRRHPYVPRKAPAPAPANRGFSLTELILALVILLIIIPQVIPLYDAFLEDSKEESLRSRIGQFRRSLTVFQQENGRFPFQLSDQYGNSTDFLDNRFSELTNGVHNAFGKYAPGRRIYMEAIPVDPITGLKDWKLVGVDNDGDDAFNEDSIEVTTSTHRLSGVVRGLTTGVVDPQNFVANDDDNDGLVDEDPVDVYDVRSRARGYSDI